MNDKPKILSDEEIDEICDINEEVIGYDIAYAICQAQAERGEQRGRELQFVEDVRWLANNEFVPCLVFGHKTAKGVEVFGWQYEYDTQDQLLSEELIGMALAVEAKLEVK